MDYSSFLGIPVKTDTYKATPEVFTTSYLSNTGKKRKHQQSTQPLKSGSKTSDEVTENTSISSNANSDKPLKKRSKHAETPSKTVSPLVLVFENLSKENGSYRIKHDHHSNKRKEHFEPKHMSTPELVSKNKYLKTSDIARKFEQKTTKMRQETPIMEKEMPSDTQESGNGRIHKFICGECHGIFVSVSAMNKHFNMCTKISDPKLLRLEVKLKEKPGQRQRNKNSEMSATKIDDWHRAQGNGTTMHHYTDSNALENDNASNDVLDTKCENVLETSSDSMLNTADGNVCDTVSYSVVNLSSDNMPDTINESVLETTIDNVLDTENDDVLETTNDDMPDIVSGYVPDTENDDVLEISIEVMPDIVSGYEPDTETYDVLETTGDDMPGIGGGDEPDTENDDVLETTGDDMPDIASGNEPDTETDDALETTDDDMSDIASGNEPDTETDDVLKTNGDDMPDIASGNVPDTENDDVIETTNDDMPDDKIPDNEKKYVPDTTYDIKLETNEENMPEVTKKFMPVAVDKNSGENTKSAAENERVLHSSFYNALDTVHEKVPAPIHNIMPEKVPCTANNNMLETAYGNMFRTSIDKIPAPIHNIMPEKVPCTANNNMLETAYGNMFQTSIDNVFQTSTDNVFQPANVNMKDIKDQASTVASDYSMSYDDKQVSNRLVNNNLSGDYFVYADWNNSDFIKSLDWSDLDNLNSPDHYDGMHTDDSGLSSLDNSDYFLQKAETCVTDGYKYLKNEDGTVSTINRTYLSNIGENMPGNMIQTTQNLIKNEQKFPSTDSILINHTTKIKQENNSEVNDMNYFLTDTFHRNRTRDKTAEKTSTPIKSTDQFYSADICKNYPQTSEQNAGEKLQGKLDYSLNDKKHQVNCHKKRQSNVCVYTEMESKATENSNTEMFEKATDKAAIDNIITCINENNLENKYSNNSYKSLDIDNSQMTTDCPSTIQKNRDNSADNIQDVNTADARTPTKRFVNSNKTSEQITPTEKCSIEDITKNQALTKDLKEKNHIGVRPNSPEKEQNKPTKQSCTDEIECRKCNVTFISKTCYTNHLIMYHHPTYTRQNLFKCPCSVWNRSHDSYYSGSLQQHLTSSHNFQDMNCFRCGIKFDCFPELHDHIKHCDKDFANKRDKHLQCTLCKAVHVIVETHEIDEILRDVEKELPAEEEVAEARTKVNQVHTNREQHSSIPKFKCKKCDKGFHLWKCCVNHMVGEHLDGINTRTDKMFRALSTKHSHPCDDCGRHKYICNANERLLSILKKGINNPLENDLQTSSQTEAANEELHKIHMVLKSLCTVKIVNEKKRRYCTACNIEFRQYGCCINHVLLHHMDNSAFEKTRFFKNDYVRCSRCKTDHMWTINNPQWLSKYLDIDREMKTSSELQEKPEPSKQAMEYAKTPEAGSVPNNSELELTVNEDSKFIDMSIAAEIQDLLAIDSGREKQFINEFGRKQSGKVEFARSRSDIEEDMKERVKIVNGKFICRICGEGFHEYDCCKDHVLTQHHVLYTYPGGSEVYGCPICKTVFQSLYFLDKHLAQYHALYKYSCLQCQSNFNFRQDYKYHLKNCKRTKIEINHHKRLSCRHCKLIHSCLYNTGESQRIKEYLEKGNNSQIHGQCHREKNCDNEPTEVPKSCDEKENTAQHDDVAFDGKNFLCLICDKIFKTAKCCSAHVLFEHKRRGDLKCPVCDQEFHFKTKIDRHLKSAHDLEQIYCKQCYLGFEDTSALKHHSKRCNGRKKSGNKLDKHVCRHCYRPHSPEEDTSKMEECADCISGFSRIECSRNHFYTEHFPDNIALVSKSNMFKCPCGKECETKSHLQMHMSKNHSNHSPNYPDSEEENHINKEVSDKGRKDLPKDGRYFDTFVTSSSGFRTCVCCDHLHIVASETSKNSRVTPRIKCDTCNKTFKTTQCYQNHELITHSGDYATRNCVECGRYFPNASSLRKHQHAAAVAPSDNLIMVHETSLRLMSEKHSLLKEKKICKRGSFLFEVTECMLCNQFHQNTFETHEMPVGNNTRRKLKEERKENENRPRKIYCKYCPLVFTSFSDLTDHEKQKHKRDEHALEEKGGKCKVCDLQLTPDEDMCEHIIEKHAKMTITDAEQREVTKFSCVYCDKNFLFVMDAQLHLRKEHFEKPLTILKHVKSNERIFGQSIIHCPLCTFVLTNKSQWIADHIRKKHFNIMPIKKPSSYICHICGAKFVGKYGLDQHMYKHKAYRSFKCDKCGKEFPFYPNLQTHMKTHIEKQEKCGICGMMFRLPHHVRAHMKRVHFLIVS